MNAVPVTPWLSEWVPIAAGVATVIAAALAICAAISSRRDRKLAEVAAAAAERGAAAQERIAAGLDQDRAELAEQHRVRWHVSSWDTAGDKSVWALSNEGGTVAKGVRVRGAGRLGSRVRGWREAVDIEPGGRQLFSLSGGQFRPVEDRVIVEWHGCPDGEEVEFG